MKFLIVGPGAMGLLFAGRLAKFANQDVVILDYKKDRADFLNKNGIKIEGIKGKFHVYVPVITVDELSFSPDFVMICVKAYNTKDAAYELKDVIDHNAVIITLQNGLGNVEILKNILKRDVYGGITAEGATLLGTGHVRHAGYGDTIIGPKNKRLIELKDVLNKAGFKTELVDDIEGLIWGKLLINVAINAITAITKLKNGMLPAIEGTRRIMGECLKEAMKVVEKKGIKLPYEDPIQKAYEVCEKTANNVSSMLQDILNQKLTEIDFINGAIVKEAKKLGLSTPVNETLTYLIQAIQNTYKDRITKK